MIDAELSVSVLFESFLEMESSEGLGGSASRLEVDRSDVTAMIDHSFDS